MNNDNFITGFEKVALNPFHAAGSLLKGTADSVKGIGRAINAVKTYAKVNLKKGKAGTQAITYKDAKNMNTRATSIAKAKATRAAKKEADFAKQEAIKARTFKAQETRAANKQKVQDKIDATEQAKKDKQLSTIKGKAKALASSPIANVVGGGVAGAVLTKGLDKATSGDRYDR